MDDERQRTEVRKQGKGFGDLRFHSTFDIIEAVEGGRFPERVMMTFHPQRWTDNPVVWGKELVWQNFKNVIKKGMVSRPSTISRTYGVNKDAKPQRII